MLRCNGQTSQEMRDAIRLQNKSSGEGIRYSLDCMIDTTNLWTTWIALPAPPKYLKRLEVDFRDFTENPQWSGDGGGIGPIGRNLLRLLGQFVSRGHQLTCRQCDQKRLARDSQFICESCKMKRPYIEVLEVNFVRRPGSTKQVVLGPKWGEMRQRGLDVRNDPDSRTLLGLGACLHRLSQSGLLFGMVGLIRLRCEGTVQECKVEDRDFGVKIHTAKLWASYGWVPGEILNQ